MEKSLNFFTQAENKFWTYGFLTKGKLSEISELDQRIAKLKEIFYAKRKDVEKEIKNNAKKTNEEILTFLETELNKLDEAESEEQFDKILNEVKKAEKKLNLSKPAGTDLFGRYRWAWNICCKCGCRKCRKQWTVSWGCPGGGDRDGKAEAGKKISERIFCCFRRCTLLSGK